jgi:hypothetical protein
MLSKCTAGTQCEGTNWRLDYVYLYSHAPYTPLYNTNRHAIQMYCRNTVWRYQLTSGMTAASQPHNRIPFYTTFSFLVWPLLPTHCRCRGLVLHLIKLTDTHTRARARARTNTNAHRLTRWDFSGRVISPTQRPLPDNTQYSQQTHIHVPGWVRTHNPSKRSAADRRLRPRGNWNRPYYNLIPVYLLAQKLRFNSGTWFHVPAVFIRVHTEHLVTRLPQPCSCLHPNVEATPVTLRL